MQIAKPVTKGTRVRTTADFVGRQGEIPAGQTGTVVFSDGDCVGIRLDVPYGALEDWGNILHFYGDSVPSRDPEDEVAAFCENVA